MGLAQPYTYSLDVAEVRRYRVVGVGGGSFCRKIREPWIPEDVREVVERLLATLHESSMPAPCIYAVSWFRCDEGLLACAYSEDECAEKTCLLVTS